MADAREVYRFRADDYDALVRCEDRDGNLLPALRGITELAGADVVELGAGTGRVTALLAPFVRSIRAFDAAPAMLDFARAKLAAMGAANVELGLADNAALPVGSGGCDVAIAGWTYGHQTSWSPGAWQEPVRTALAEMIRVLRPGGIAIVIETLGTGHVAPFEPPAELGAYYAMLERELGFERIWIRTDYAFPSEAEARRLVTGFFGEAVAGQLTTERGRCVLPECTGIWWRAAGS